MGIGQAPKEQDCVSPPLTLINTGVSLTSPRLLCKYMLPLRRAFNFGRFLIA
jgi:hypothetical protein